MKIHKVFKKKIVVNDTEVFIKYWCDQTSVYVAAYDDKDIRVSMAIYRAEVEHADQIFNSAQESLIDGLSNLLEDDLLNKTDIHYRPRHF